MKKFALAAVAAAAFAAPAFAQDTAATGPAPDAQFAGFRVEALTGYDNVGVRGARNPDGVIYGAGIGYDIQADGWVFGVEGEYADSSTKTNLGGGFRVVSDRDLYVGGRVGFVAGDSLLVYAKAGYTNARLETDGPGADFGVNLDGFRLGAGVEFALGTNLFVKGEYRYSNYESGGTRNQGLVGVGFRF